MKLNYSCCGFCGVTKEIVPPEINKVCPNCNSRMILIDSRGLHNSGSHTFTAECPNCKYKEKFSDYKLWKRCIEISRDRGIN